MNSLIVRWLGSALVAGTLAVSSVLPSYAAQSVAPEQGVPGTAFVFKADGFSTNGEKVAFWINTPDGQVISTKPLPKADKAGNTTTPLMADAGTTGEATLYWTAPSTAALGNYTLVAHGLASQHEDVIPFSIDPQGSMRVVQTDITPASGPAGTAFVVHATGFQGATKGDTGEQVSFWINTPDGSIISTKPLSSADSAGNTTTPLLAQAGADGIVKIFWDAPASAMPGSYTMVIHGLDSQHEVVVPFSIK
ncbi:hypothetical protein K2Z83_11660 [Oscillochloris sp. ZM17-4]|uniref:hypothetical protein n=1 Tax=Oscillochloris sp. ZM17-4 TaxID=2866714 RepID=UPI001C72F279|nr:hypothetical protein [Oscillochloris sp. ZM17-4]MBX0328332.1 hypothetical protein [Oscillochloris sp. ZM17-4]